MVSLGLHTALLALPLAPSPEVAPELVEPESLDVTVLPAAPVVKPTIPPTAPSPPLASAAAEVTAQAPLAPKPTAQSRSQPQPVVETPLPKADEQPLSDPEPPAPDPPVPPASEAPPTPYQDFPHLAEATAGCQGLSECWRSPAPSWRAAAGALREQLETQGYELENITDQVVSEDTGVQVYEVARSGTPQYYLHLISVAGGVLYTLAQEPLTADAIAAIEQF